MHVDEESGTGCRTEFGILRGKRCGIVGNRIELFFRHWRREMKTVMSVDNGVWESRFTACQLVLK